MMCSGINRNFKTIIGIEKFSAVSSLHCFLCPFYVTMLKRCQKYQ